MEYWGRQPCQLFSGLLYVDCILSKQNQRQRLSFINSFDLNIKAISSSPCCGRAWLLPQRNHPQFALLLKILFEIKQFFSCCFLGIMRYSHICKTHRDKSFLHLVPSIILH